MPFQQPDAVRYYTFESLAGPDLIHAVFTRQGGVSSAPWDELNLGGTVGDNVEHVAENRRRVFATLGRSLDSLYDVWQVHSADVVRADAPRLAHVPHHLADVIITNRPNVTLLMRFADCVPILLYDPIQRVVGLAHAGWQGTVKRVAAAAVQAMQAEYGTKPENLQAAIGPSIGPHHYQVGLDVISQVQSVFGQDAPALLPGFGEQSQNTHFDLWQANRLVLEQAGVPAAQVETAKICTACHPEDWFSHRGEHGKTGRFGAVIALRS